MSIQYTQTWLELSRAAMQHNIACYKNRIGAQTMLGVVVKSNAYGHGLRQVGEICQNNDTVSYLCTANALEAIALREAGITKPILAMYFLNTDPEAVVTYDLDMVIYDYETAALLSRFAQKQRKNAYVHIKIDTGLSRFGLFAHEAFEVITRIFRLPNIVIRGITTHFVQSDKEDQTFTRQQLTLFTDLISRLQQSGITIPIKHTSNSTAVLGIKDAHHNLVRVGAGVYGIVPKHIQDRHADIVSLKQALTWKTRIMYTKTIPAGSSVSYDRLFIAPRETIIAILPVGYYEGYDRKLSNNGNVLVSADGITRLHHHYAPVLGRICMNFMIIDVTDVPQARVGDEVILMGDFDGVRAYDLAHRIGSTNPREITTRLPTQIPCIIVE
jgi:alanine racemase